MATKEVIYDCNGGNPSSLDTDVIDELVTYDLVKRNHMGQPQFVDFCSMDTYEQDLAFQRDGIPRSW